MTPLLPRPLKAPGWMTGCLARAGRQKHTQVTNELHQTPRVSLSSISSQPNPGRKGGHLPGEGAVDTPLFRPGPPEPWLLVLPPALLHRDPGPNEGVGAGSKCLPLGPDFVLLLSLWPGIWAVDSDNGGHAVSHTGDNACFLFSPGPWSQASSYWPAAPNTCRACPAPLGQACDKGPFWQDWACLPPGRATEGLRQVTGG